MHQQPMQLFHLCMIHQMLEKPKPGPLLSHQLWLWRLFQMWCLCQTSPFHHLYKLMYRNLSACTRCFVPCANFACCALFGTTARATAGLQIILQTAKFVRQAGGQTEFVLRVKQAGNPNFRFLEPNDQQHPYFRWLVATKPEVSCPLANEGNDCLSSRIRFCIA